MDPATNPFAPGAGNQPPELTGRGAVLAEAAVVLDRLRRRMVDRSQILIGLRGVGKTVLLNRIDKMARERGFYSAILEAPEKRSLADIRAPELRKLLLQLDLLEGAKEHRQTGARRTAGLCQCLQDIDRRRRTWDRRVASGFAEESSRGRLRCRFAAIGGIDG